MLALYVFSLIVGVGFILVSLAGDFLDVGVEVDADPELEWAADSTWSKVFSLQSVVYGMAGFGLAGTLLTVLQVTPGPVTLGLALGTGVAGGMLVGLFLGYLKRSDSGYEHDDRQFEGCAADVLIPIRPDNAGRIKVYAAGRTHQLRALPHSLDAGSEDLSSWKQVVVVEVKDGVAYVTPLEETGLLSEDG